MEPNSAKINPLKDDFKGCLGSFLIGFILIIICLVLASLPKKTEYVERVICFSGSSVCQKIDVQYTGNWITGNEITGFMMGNSKTSPDSCFVSKANGKEVCIVGGSEWEIQ